MYNDSVFIFIWIRSTTMPRWDKTFSQTSRPSSWNPSLIHSSCGCTWWLSMRRTIYVQWKNATPELLCLRFKEWWHEENLSAKMAGKWFCQSYLAASLTWVRWDPVSKQSVKRMMAPWINWEMKSTLINNGWLLNKSKWTVRRNFRESESSELTLTEKKVSDMLTEAASSIHEAELAMEDDDTDVEEKWCMSGCGVCAWIIPAFYFGLQKVGRFMKNQAHKQIVCDHAAAFPPPSAPFWC